MISSPPKAAFVLDGARGPLPLLLPNRPNSEDGFCVDEPLDVELLTDDARDVLGSRSLLVRRWPTVSLVGSFQDTSNIVDRVLVQ